MQELLFSETLQWQAKKRILNVSKILWIKLFQVAIKWQIFDIYVRSQTNS